jgi:hypothetical protein
MTPYLAVLAGKIVDNRDVCNRFLADVRRTIGDCIADNHYARFAELAHGYGLKIHPESGGPHSAPIDALRCLGRNDIPMGEFWARSQTHRIRDEDRLFGKQAASAAHIYGKKLVNAGATIVGPRPLKSPGLANYPQCDSLVNALSAEMWGQCDGYRIKEHSYGKGRVFWK